jgi:hypothetical protein
MGHESPKQLTRFGKEPAWKARVLRGAVWIRLHDFPSSEEQLGFVAMEACGVPGGEIIQKEGCAGSQGTVLTGFGQFKNANEVSSGVGQ